MKTNFQQSGFVMLEGLIAILIFSMAILAVVGLQATAITKGTESQYRADAAFLANQLLAQMWVHSGSGVINTSGVIVAGNAALSGVAAAPNLYNYSCMNCTVALATAAGTKAGDPEFVRWLQSIQGTATQPGFLPGVTDTTNMPDIDVHCSAADLALMPTCSAATQPQSATQVTITLYWQKSMRAGVVPHQYTTISNIEPN
jgi:type IV pilus assembly protein PilV